MITLAYSKRVNDVLKFICSEKAKNFDEIFTILLTTVNTVKSKGEDFAKFCGLLRIYELYTVYLKRNLPADFKNEMEVIDLWFLPF